MPADMATLVSTALFTDKLSDDELVQFSQISQWGEGDCSKKSWFPKVNGLNLDHRSVIQTVAELTQERFEKFPNS